MAISSALEQNISLDRLDLSYCEIDDRGIQKLSTSLKSNRTLRFLNIEGNYPSSSGMYSLLKCIYDTSSIQSLWESNHTIRAFYGQRAIYSPRWVCVIEFVDGNMHFHSFIDLLTHSLASASPRLPPIDLLCGNWSMFWPRAIVVTRRRAGHLYPLLHQTTTTTPHYNHWIELLHAKYYGIARRMTKCKIGIVWRA